MAGTGSLSSTFNVYIEQSAPIAAEVLTTSALPRGGRVLGFIVEILDKVNGAGPDAHTVEMFVVPAGAAQASITSTGGAAGPVSFSTASVASPTTFPSRQVGFTDISAVTTADAVFAAGDQLRVQTTGGAGDTCRLRVHFICTVEPAPAVVVANA